jgi:hypothetical protein
MSWPIGYGTPDVSIHADAAGRIFADGLPISDPGGWIDLPAPDWRNDASGELSVRLRVTPDDHGRPFVYAEQCELAGRRYPGIHSLALSEGHQWPEHVVVAFHALIRRRIADSTRATTSLRAVSAPRARESERLAPPDVTRPAGVSALRDESAIEAALARAKPTRKLAGQGADPSEQG